MNTFDKATAYDGMDERNQNGGSDPYQEIYELLEKYRREHFFEEAVFGIFNRKEILKIGACGPADPSARFDLASLTKIITGTLILQAAEEGRLSLWSPAAAYLPALPGRNRISEALKTTTLYQLLTHTSGLPAWYPLYTRTEGLWAILDEILTLPLKKGQVVYSDLNFIILGEILSAVLHLPLNRAVNEKLCIPLGLRSLSYLPDGQDTPGPASGPSFRQDTPDPIAVSSFRQDTPGPIAVSSSRQDMPGPIAVSSFGNAIEEEMCQKLGLSFSGFRNPNLPIRGEANDGNCWYYFHGVSGHAGIFSNAEDLCRLGMFYLRQKDNLFARAQKEILPHRGLAFETGELYPEGCGHTGFTGTSLYLSLTADIGAVLLTNRLFYCEGTKAPDLRECRMAFHHLVHSLCSSGSIRPASESDIPAMADIYREDLLDTYQALLPAEYFGTLTKQSAAKTWYRFYHKEDCRCYIWEEDGAVAAFAAVKPDSEKAETLLLSALYVSRQYQGRRIGPRLIQFVLQTAQKEGWKWVSISVVLKNQRARELYQKLGAVYEKTFPYSFGDYPLDCGRYLWELSSLRQPSFAKQTDSEA